MHPPPDAVEALASVAPTARLAWYGEDAGDGPDKELNKGEFALLQLYRRRDPAKGVYEPWDNRGPVFGKDWRRDVYEPVWLANFTPEEVFGGSFIRKVKRWQKPLWARVRDSAIERGKRFEQRISDLAGEMGSRVYRDAQRGYTVSSQAKKFVTREDKAVLSGEMSKDLTHEFVPTKPAGVK